jgi:hypothetical protein
MVSVEKFCLPAMALNRGCTKEQAIGLLGRVQLFCSILAAEIVIGEDGLYYWSSRC